MGFKTIEEQFELEETRRLVEVKENWERWAKTLPSFSFPSGWSIAIIPPCRGAMVRFIAKQNGAEVSVYLDTLDRLGYVRRPYWEIYPNTEGDCSRFFLGEEKEMLKEIQLSLDLQNKKGEQNEQK